MNVEYFLLFFNKLYCSPLCFVGFVWWAIERISQTFLFLFLFPHFFPVLFFTLLPLCGGGLAISFCLGLFVHPTQSLCHRLSRTADDVSTSCRVVVIVVLGSRFIRRHLSNIIGPIWSVYIPFQSEGDFCLYSFFQHKRLRGLRRVPTFFEDSKSHISGIGFMTKD